ncbi:uncharacterized protein [Primulina huaijiensis]|uniref:uncharacterized protein isoform X4 n=1 Tax=Primulina huaijiensis TaxID=1492673 RepID=UPI003CC72107
MLCSLLRSRKRRPVSFAPERGGQFLFAFALGVWMLIWISVTLYVVCFYSYGVLSFSPPEAFPRFISIFLYRNKFAIFKKNQQIKIMASSTTRTSYRYCK